MDVQKRKACPIMLGPSHFAMPKKAPQAEDAIPVPKRLIYEAQPAAIALYASVASAGGLSHEGCSLPIAELGLRCGVCLKVARRELSWLAQHGWISEVHQSGYATVRRIAI